MRTTLGIRGERLAVPTRDDKRCVYAYTAMNLVTGSLSYALVDVAPKHLRDGKSKTRVMQEGFVRHLRLVARAYPPDQYPRVVLIIDNAPWHAGAAVREVLAQHSHLELYRLPSYSPQLNPIERLWRILRRRATHNRFFPSPKELKRRLEKNFCYYQAARRRILSLIRAPGKRSKAAGA